MSKTSTRRSLYYSFLDRYSGLLISVVSSMVIARLLTPEEIGVYSVTMVLLMFASTFRDMGAGQYMVQEPDLTVERIRAVWTVQLGLGVGLALLFMLASHPVALFYNEPRMRDIMLLVALNYAINPFGSLTHAWLMREMRFDSSALIRFSGGLTGAMVSTWMAWKDYGPISLAWGALASTVVAALMAVYFRPKFFPWMPGLREVRRVLVFGSHLTASAIMTTISNGAPELLLGKLQSLTATGLYSRANGLVQMFQRLFVDAVGAVCLPWFSKQSRERGNVVAPFLKATAYVSAFGWTFCVLIVCLAHPIVRALYGTQWDHSVDLARLLAVAMAFRVPATLCRTALLSSGAVATISRITLFSSIQTVAMIAIGASQGLFELGLAAIIAMAIGSAMWINAALREIKLSWLDLLRSLRSTAMVSLLSAAGPAAALWIYGPYPENFVLPLVVGGSGGMVGFLCGILIFRHPLREELVSMYLALRNRLG